MESTLRISNPVGGNSFPGKSLQSVVTERISVSNGDDFVRLKDCKECGKKNQRHKFDHDEELAPAMSRYDVQCCNCNHTETAIIIPEDNLGLENTRPDLSLQPVR